MTPSQLDAMIAESGLTHDDATELAAALSPLVALSDDAAPAPSAELRRLFGDAPRPSPQADPDSLPREWGGHRTRATLAGVVVLALSGVGATGLSAAANTLPRAWQQGVAGFSRHYLPFDFPEPSARSEFAEHADEDRVVRGGRDDLVGSRDASTGATRSTTEDRAATEDASSAAGPGRRHEGRADLHPTGHAVSGGPEAEPAATSAPQPLAEEGAPGHPENLDGPRPSRSPDGTDRPGDDGRGKDADGKQDGNIDDTDHGDRPVKASGPTDVQKGPQKAPQKSPQNGTQSGTQQGGPQEGPGGGADQGSGAPEEPPRQEDGAKGPTGPSEAPAGKDATGAVGDSLSLAAQLLESDAHRT